jgi:hypothetical protein
MTDEKIMQTCELCPEKYQHGPHRYEGKHSVLFDLWVCPNCWEGNEDGWNPRHETKLLAHLKEKGIPTPAKNEKGLYPRG